MAPATQVGAHARVHGLTSRPDLNGAEVALLRLNLDVGRWEVRNVATRECFRVRPGNLMATTGGASTGSAPADSHASQHASTADPTAGEARAADDPPAADDVPPTALLDHLGPDELGSVFQELDLKARCTALQVCTSFHAAGSARADAWRECDFGSEPRAQLRDEDVARILRRAGRQLAVLKVSGQKLTCAALRPLRDCSRLERLNLTGCACVDARALGRHVLPPDEGYLASLSVDGIDSLDEESVGRLQSLVRSSQLDVTECDVCKQFVVCKVCADGCGVQICSEDAEDMLTCDACKRFWCNDCDEIFKGVVCDGPCGRTICEDCMFKDGAFLMFCEGCNKCKCGKCAFEGGAYMITCGGCHTSKCEDCVNTGGGFMLTCADCYTATCDKCMCDAGSYMHTCMDCYSSKCQKCAFKGGAFMVNCADCYTTRCDKCMCGAGRFMNFCEVCYTCKCEKCTFKSGMCSCGA